MDLFFVPYPLSLDTLMGALTTPILRHQTEARGKKTIFTMQAGAYGETDYDTFMTLVELC
jgi:hypothetical protein